MSVPVATRSAAELEAAYSLGCDGEHPLFTRAEWRVEVEMCTTISGYWQWLADKLKLIGPPLAKSLVLVALRNAVRTQITHWAAMNALETMLGFPDGSIDTRRDEMLVEYVKCMAAGGEAPDGSDVLMEHVETLADTLRVKL